MDDVYSQDPNDPEDKLKIKRSKSSDKLAKVMSSKLERKDKELKRGRTISPDIKGGFKSLLKP